MRSTQAQPSLAADPEKIAAVLQSRRKLGPDFPRFAVFIVSYRAMERLSAVLERIPPEIYDLLAEIYIFDDFSPDRTHELCRAYLDSRRLAKVSLYRNPRNYGYGGNQKLGYEYALAKGYDYVILLHGDGQYAPERIPDLMLPALEAGAQAVFGSRMLTPGAARAGGMPRYKFLGNRVLTAFQNLMLHQRLSEYHSGYRLYGTRLLRRLQFQLNTDDFHFDTQIILQGLAAGERIVEVPIPTYYGDEISRVNGLQYALNVVLAVLDYRLHRLGITRTERYVVPDAEPYAFKDFLLSSHDQVLGLVRPGARVLDLGCGPGLLAPALKDKGCHVTGVDTLEPGLVSPRLDHYLQADLDKLELPFGHDFDCVILADVLEHLPRPEQTLIRARRYLKENGDLIVSLPNIALWVYRLALLAGRFEYTDRGILDRTHLRFFTLATARHLLAACGFHLEAEQYVPIPFHLLSQSGARRRVADRLTRLYHLACRLWPQMFAYQIVFRARLLRLEWEELRRLPLEAETRRNSQ